MIKVKHFCEAIESDDGQRIWVEPIGCTKDLLELCSIDHVLSHLGPPKKLWEWLDAHPDGYDFFRAQYHEHLSKGPYLPALQQLAAVSGRETFTLLHQGDHPEQNSAMALYEYLTELQAYIPPD
jgi:uncharacterized protein YeaO (DUF488 family)